MNNKTIAMYRLTEANNTLPYVQDDDKWIAYYVEQAKKQKREDDQRRKHVFGNVKPKVVMPTAQLAAQSESERKAEEATQSTPHMPIEIGPHTPSKDITSLATNKKASSPSSSSSSSHKRRRKRSASKSPTRKRSKKKSKRCTTSDALDD